MTVMERSNQQNVDASSTSTNAVTRIRQSLSESELVSLSIMLCY